MSVLPSIDDAYSGKRPPRIPGPGGPARREVVPERPHRRFDARFVADARIVFIQLEHQVGLPVSVHDGFEELDGESVRRTPEGGDEHRVGPFGPGDGLGGLEYFGRVVPVDLIQERAQVFPFRIVAREHVLEKGLDAQRAEYLGYALVHPSGKHRVGTPEKDRVDVLQIGGLLQVPFFQPFHGVLSEGEGLLEGPVHVRQSDSARRGDGLEGPEELKPRVEGPVEVIDQGGEHPVRFLRGGRASPGRKGGRILGVIAVFAADGLFLCLLFEIERQEDIIGFREKVGDVGVEGGHRGAELDPGQRFAGLHGFPVSLAGDGGNGKCPEKDLPEFEIVRQVQRRRESHDGEGAVGPGVLEMERPLPLPERAEAGPVGRDRRLDVIVPAAKETARHRLAVHFGHGDLAVVGAERARLDPHGYGVPENPGAPEAGGRGAAVGQGEGRADGPGQVAEPGDVNGFPEPLLEGGHQGPVPGRRPLETDDVPDVLFRGHLVEVVFGNAVQHRGQDFLARVPFGEQVIDVPFHEDRAAVARHGGRRVQGAPGVFGEGAIQLLRLFLDEAPRSGSADRVHVAEGHAAAPERREFGILAADLDDGVHIGLQLAGGPRVGRDLVHQEVHPHDAARELPARPGDGRARDLERTSPAPRGFLDGGEKVPNGLDGVPGGSGVIPGDDPAPGRHQGQLGAGGTHVDPEERFQGGGRRANLRTLPPPPG